MLSVVVFGLGAAALVAQNELRAPRLGALVAESGPASASTSPDGARHVHTSSSPTDPLVWSPARDVAR